MMDVRMARIGLLVDQKAAARRWSFGENVFQAYIGEILSHAGIGFERLSHAEEIGASGCDIVLAALADEGKSDALLDYVQKGGVVVAYGGLHGLAQQLGFIRGTPLSAGYAVDGRLGDKGEGLRYERAEPWYINDRYGTSHVVSVEECGTIGKGNDEVEGVLLHRIGYGAGQLDRWAVDIPTVVVQMQQGTHPVLEDGVPAPDGTGQVNEGILKADDAIAFDWSQDRIATASGQMLFPLPQADLWRERLISHLIGLSLEKGMTLPFLGYWPEGVDYVATISHDSDHNKDEDALATLELLAECGVRSTWCMIEPGYTPSVYERVKAGGHELAFHYNALEIQGGIWSEEEFRRQHQWLKEAAGIQGAVSNKNHYTRYEGWGELFAWCEQEGIQVDQTRGPSKPGNVGFLFGTCHPYYPVAWADERNRLYDVLETSFLTQDMELPNWADSTLVEPCLDQVKRVGGLAHFLFHQVHIGSKPDVRESFRYVVREAEKRGFQFWTSAEINHWVRARRLTKIERIEDTGEVAVSQAQPGTVVWIPVLAGEGGEVETRFGHPCRKQVMGSWLQQAVVKEAR